MTRRRPDELEFTEPDDPALLERMLGCQTAGAGWINVEPIVEEEHQPPEPGPFAFLGGSTHRVPVATWMPGRRLVNGSVKPTTLGLQHAAGPRIARKLRDLGLPVPPGWRVTQDHPKRGLVVTVPADADNAEAMRWLLAAASATCAVPSTGTWRAAIHPGAG
ncbi:MAG: hypothetical protein ACYCVN_09745 [Acidimicrobiales bacterium]